MRWEPLLEGADAVKAKQVVRAIEVLVARATSVQEPVLTGTAGMALFLAYAEATGSYTAGGATRLLEACLKECLHRSLHIGLWTGGAGVRWVLDHLTDRSQTDPAISRFDETIVATLQDSAIDIEFDLYSGLAGVALAYVDDRAPIGRQVVDLVLDRLELVDWNAERRAGSAHGVSGVIAALVRCVTGGTCAARAQSLLRTLIQRELRHELDPERVGWCRGEAGVAPVLLSAARVLDDRQLAQSALELALALSFEMKRNWPSVTLFCHGTSGLAHSCNRMYQATGNADLREAARYWMRCTMAMLEEEIAHGSQGQAATRTPSPPNPTLLLGASGAAMTILAATSEATPCWDRVFGMDIV
jgi:lantibiotic modifying enzyme